MIPKIYFKKYQMNEHNFKKSINWVFKNNYQLVKMIHKNLY